ncbi:MAG: AI-2E family transporter [Pyrinomonadaceae bacterium]
MAEQKPVVDAVNPLAGELVENASQPVKVRLDSSSPSVSSIVRVVVITLLILFVAGSVETLIKSVASLFFLIILSVFFGYLIDPLVQIVRRPFKDRNLERLMPRSLAIIISYIFVFSILGIAIANIAPRVVNQAKEFGENIPAYATSLRTRAIDINRRFERLRVPDEIQAEINKKVSDLGGDITASVGRFLLISVSFLPWFLLIPILAFFFLKDANVFRLAILRMFPPGRWRYRAEVFLRDVNTTLAAYTRAQIISSLIIGLICTLGFTLIGVKYALLWGILAGIFEFVPLLGPITIAVIVTTTAAASDDPWRALYVVIFLAILRIVHDYVTYPRIVRGGIHLHPLAIILSILAGEQVAGIPGVFLAIPIVAVATVVYRHILEHQGRSGLLSGWIDEPKPKLEDAA